jgi:hypothetical protein
VRKAKVANVNDTNVPSFSQQNQVREFRSFVSLVREVPFVSLYLLISMRWNGQLESVRLEMLDMQKWKLCGL